MEKVKLAENQPDDYREELDEVKSTLYGKIDDLQKQINDLRLRMWGIVAFASGVAWAIGAYGDLFK